MSNPAIIKSLTAALVLTGSGFFLGGCAQGGFASDPLAPPAYSSSENAQRIFRNMDFDRAQLIDDFDAHVFMTRPASKLTKWNVMSFD